MSDSSIFQSNYYFKVLYGEIEMYFQEVSGIHLKNTIPDDSKLPREIKFENIILKRGLCHKNMPFEIINDNFSFKFSIKKLSISLMNKDGQALQSWECLNATPVGIQMNPADISLDFWVIESLEMSYTQISITF